MPQEPPPLTEEELEELQDMQEEAAEDSDQDRFENNQEWQERYGSPEPEEKHNQHTFLSNAVKSLDTVRTTYLDEWELGKPMFNVRFLLDMEDISKFYLDEMAEELSDTNKKVVNNVSNYFRQKILNVTDSGMSKEGFTMNLNVTRKMDSIRKKVRVSNIENLKGGKRKR
ncbi:hypothetical protein LCGC14_0545770 [marine sediment metagenome]|uniref:Uncharacterized protein n=1 Tax=marine sediment metagenome TaxID=412755 RepID=A0A0F9S9R8_9ZZZZ